MPRTIKEVLEHAEMRWSRRSANYNSLLREADQLVRRLETMREEERAKPFQERIQGNTIVLIESDFVTNSSRHWEKRYGVSILGSRNRLDKLAELMDTTHCTGAIVHVSDEGDEIPVIEAHQKGKKVVAITSSNVPYYGSNQKLIEAGIPCVSKASYNSLEYIDAAFEKLAMLF